MSRNTPLVSVLVPAYNAERYVAETLASVTAQTYPAIEVVVVDDGSTDRTAEVVGAYPDPRVRLIRQTNAGASTARNRALREARGTYIQYLDADDLLSPDKIERQVQLLQQAPLGCVAVCATVYFDDGTDPVRGQLSPGYPELNSDDPVQWMLNLWTPGPGYGTTRWGMVQPNAWLVPEGILEEAGAWDERLTVDDDGEYFTRVLLASAGIRWEPNGKNFYRKFPHGGSLSSRRSERDLKSRLLAVDSKVQGVMPRTTYENRNQAAVALARQYLDVAFHAYPRHLSVVRCAEMKAAKLCDYSEPFFANSKLAYIERIAGWKMAKYFSHAFRALEESWLARWS